MVERVNYKFNLLPQTPRANKSLAALVREEVEGRGKKWLVCFKKTKLPQSLESIGAVELRDLDLYDDIIFDARGFIKEFCKKLVELCGCFEETPPLDKLSFAVSELLKNSFLHGNKGRPGKTVVVSFKKARSGLVIDFFDEGKGPLILFRIPADYRDFINCFRIGYCGQNIGIAATQRYFGKENLTATKVFNESGKRVGTRVRIKIS